MKLSYLLLESTNYSTNYSKKYSHLTYPIVNIKTWYINKDGHYITSRRANLPPVPSNFVQ